jgi:hypothetical protein
VAFTEAMVQAIGGLSTAVYCDMVKRLTAWHNPGKRWHDGGGHADTSPVQVGMARLVLSIPHGSFNVYGNILPELSMNRGRPYGSWHGDRRRQGSVNPGSSSDYCTIRVFIRAPDRAF